MDNFVAAVVGLIGVSAGALLQYWLSRRAMCEFRQSEQVGKAYSDYLQSVAGVTQAQRNKDNSGLRDCLRQLTEAKTRIAVYGNSDVMEKLATFERLGAALSTSEQRSAFISIIRAMRRTEANGAAEVVDRDVMLVIFGEDE
jgi:hypothetical protein